MTPVGRPTPPKNAGPRVNPIGQARDMARAAAHSTRRGAPALIPALYVLMCALLLIALLFLRGADLAGAWLVLVVGWGSGLLALILASRWADPLAARPRDPEPEIILGAVGIIGWALMPALLALII